MAATHKGGSNMLATAAIIFATVIQTATAAPLSIAKATDLLARSQAANDKCKVLSVTETADLDELTARARLALIATSSVKEAERVLAHAHNVGTGVRCDETTKRGVEGVLQVSANCSRTISRRPCAALSQTLSPFNRRSTKPLGPPSVKRKFNPPK